MKKTYSGTYTVKNPSKYKGDVNNVVYRSGWERYAFLWCDDNPDIVEWSSEEIIVPYYYEATHRYHRYFPDLYYRTRQGRKYLIEIKPGKETKAPQGSKRTKRFIEEGYTYIKNQNKWEAAQEYAKKHGMEFHIWTETELQGLGIMPKSFGKVPGTLKKMPAYKKPRKRK